MVAIGLGIFLLLNLIAGLVRILSGPTRADRMVAVQFFGTAGVAILLLLGRGLDIRALDDVALVLALLAAVGAVAFAGRIWPALEEDNDGLG